MPGRSDSSKDQDVVAKRFYSKRTATSLSTAGVETYTAAQILGGIIVRDPNGAGRTDTLSTAALLVAAMDRPEIGDCVAFMVINGADAAEAITLAAGTGGSFDANQTAASRVVAQNSQKEVTLRLTGVASGSEAYVIYS